ncbi:Redoxin [Gilbertella persicaria]|uniref:Redoxin n=1 Tax=Gilbertella persicaria TaxID=101096 RepID=UPI00221EACC5|nr:Redoxin [Gilbertella persicaria]KAI8081883.1 Redoxin [Gilbertella persicaria]
MTISVGDTLPQCKLAYVPYDPNLSPTACPAPVPYDLGKELKGKKAIIFAIPGAFTPTCSEQHVPAYLEKYDELKKKVDVIICTAANDGFVMHAFGRHLNVKDKIIMASEGGSDFFQQLGLTLDLSSRGMGVRSKRFALVVDDLKVTYVGVDEQGLDKSGPEAVLKSL